MYTIPLTSFISLPNIKLSVPRLSVPVTDSSVFLGRPASSTGPKTVTNTSDVTITYKDPQPQIVQAAIRPNLPLIPVNYPPGLEILNRPSYSLQPIVVAPGSNASLEITSPDSDKIITVSGSKDNITEFKDAIEKSHKYNKAVASAAVPSASATASATASAASGTVSTSTMATIARNQHLISSNKILTSQSRPTTGTASTARTVPTTITSAPTSIQLSDLFDVSKLRSLFSNASMTVDIKERTKHPFEIFLNNGPQINNGLYGPIITI